MSFAAWWAHLSCAHCALVMALPLTGAAIGGSIRITRRQRRATLLRRLNSPFHAYPVDTHRNA
jgi:hypothetical protein